MDLSRMSATEKQILIFSFYRDAELPPVDQLQRLPEIDVLPVTAVEGQEFVDRRTVRETERVRQGGSRG